uniref:NADH-ubiquinone oxidoreductase chain 4 n=1 Tax=Stachyamoeba lipophora TaxID=463046 RepID=A0A0B5GMX0_STALP|nr:NADH dehydrogenase subunit 4 [Stachyamoeba lipophora]AJF22898.1 NADH dehydrogenase subunit 4 [Stachyamoeba lipophora]
MINSLSSKIILIFSLFLFLLSVLLWVVYDPFDLAFQKTFSIYLFDIYFHFGVDGISLFFIYLTCFLLPLCLIFTWNSKSILKTDFMYALFSIELLLILVFCVTDLLLFYIFFEAILIPFFIYIGICGYRKRRVHAAFLFFFFTLFGSLLMFISIVFVYLHCGSTDFLLLWTSEFSTTRELVLWFFFFIAFAIKIPIFPFHNWLPEAHVEAPTEGSVLLAGLLLKLGAYGFLRVNFFMFPYATFYFSPLVLVLNSLAVVYVSMTTLRQIDIKKIIAYSSVAHMNMAMLGFFLFDSVSLCGSFLMMVGHGIIAAGLFFLIGIFYDRYKTKLIFYYSGLVQCMPLAISFFFLLILGNTSLPTTANFVSEFLVICGFCIKSNIVLIICGSIGIFLGTIYSMWLFNKVSFGFPYYSLNRYVTDLTLAEICILLPIIFHMFWIGLFPNEYLDVFQPFLSSYYFCTL